MTMTDISPNELSCAAIIARRIWSSRARAAAQRRNRARHGSQPTAHIDSEPWRRRPPKYCVASGMWGNTTELGIDTRGKIV